MPATVSGLNGLVANLKRLVDAVPAKAAAALKVEAEVEMTEAKRRTPVETGALRSTGIVSEPAIVGNKVTVQMSFGGPAVDYAVPVHENLEAHHPHGQAKYLESVVMESAPYLARRIAAAIQLGK